MTHNEMTAFFANRTKKWADRDIAGLVAPSFAPSRSDRYFCPCCIFSAHWSILILRFISGREPQLMHRHRVKDPS
jgi:hypothetical protein